MCAIRLEDLLPQLAAVRVDRVEASGDLLRIAARTWDDVAAVCPGCGTESDWAHSRYVRHVADEAVGGRAVVIDLSVRRLHCENSDCPKTTFAEQVTGLTVRYQRRTPALQHVVNAVAVALAGSAGARLLAVLHCALSWATVLNCLMRIPLPSAAVPHVLGIDEFALRRGHRYATIIIDAATGARVDVLADRAKEPVATWLRTHAGFEVVCRDGAGSFAQAITDAAPHAVQVADRWHLWHLLGEAAHREVLAHSACWASLGPPIREGRHAQTTRERWQQVHDLRDQGVGLLECARRLNLALNTVKCYARHAEPDRLIRTPQYRPTLVDPYREQLRKRRGTDPAVPVTHLLAEIRELGYTGSANLLVRYITQGRVEADHATLSPRRTARLLLTDPAHLKEEQAALRDKLSAACPEMTALVTQVSDFAALLTPGPGNPGRLNAWIARTRAADLPFLHSFATSLERDRAAVDAALTLPWHNGRTEGVNHKIKLLKRQTYGRAGFPLLRQRILLS
ncbi:ISL3 family transposase [Streptomyces phaeochromogenes]|nr:ISL3 family transposase [Streptomyces phaeochromogenes]MCX4564492.1 ISL3 family transposase [Streptomyces phaeochromogenes]